MIRALMHRPGGGPVVVLGLDGENITRLLADEPIYLNLRALDPGPASGLPDIDVMIYYDADPAAAFQEAIERRR